MNSDALVKAIAAALMLLENSGEDEIDPDTAIKGLESISHELHVLSGRERAEFMDAIERIAQAEADVRQAEFIRDIPRMIGMVGPLSSVRTT